MGHCIKIVEGLALKSLAYQIKHSKDGEGKCTLLLSSLLIMNMLLYLMKRGNPENKREITLYA